MTGQGDSSEREMFASTEDALNAKLQQEIEDALGDASLMDLVDPGTATGPSTKQELRKGTVVALQGEDILIDLGGKSTGVLPVKQLGEEPMPAIGDVLEVAITGYNEDEGLVQLSRQDAVREATWESLEVGQNLEGRVTAHNKGGLELTIDGIDAFMPISQIDRLRVESDELGTYVNQKLRCQVTEIRRHENSLIVSRRALLEQEAAAARETLLDSLAEGQLLEGTVKTIMPYGAFVDIGGVDGLLHVRDMGYSRVEDPRSVVQEGQTLTVKVLAVHREDKKIALGLKQTMPDPWADAVETWPVDSLVRGRITRLAHFGAFIELAAGVEGLIPISEMTYERRISHPREMVSEGDVVETRVLAVDIERHRIGLSLKRVGDDPWVGASIRWPQDSIAQGVVTRLADFGAFVELAPGVEGLIHISELADGPVHNVGEMVKEGDNVEAKVLGVDEERRRLSLSLKQRRNMPDWTGDQPDRPAPATRPARKRKKPLRGGLD